MFSSNGYFRKVGFLYPSRAKKEAVLLRIEGSMGNSTDALLECIDLLGRCGSSFSFVAGVIDWFGMPPQPVQNVELKPGDRPGPIITPLHFKVSEEVLSVARFRMLANMSSEMRDGA